MRIVTLATGVGNVRSVLRALDRATPAVEGREIVASADPDVARSADVLVVPGQGSFGAFAKALDGGLRQAVFEKVRAGTPYLGICLGLQILFEHSEEGGVDCLGWFPGQVRRFSDKLRVPQIGWNAVRRTREHALLKGLDEENYFYFVNSYYVAPEPALVLGQATYDVEFAAMVSRDNVHATQFHAEKSGPVGLTILKNFAALGA